MSSLNRDKKIIKMITKLYPQRIKKKFVFKVRMIKTDYLNMIKNKYISTLLSLSNSEIMDITFHKKVGTLIPIPIKKEGIFKENLDNSE